MAKTLNVIVVEDSPRYSTFAKNQLEFWKRQGGSHGFDDYAVQIEKLPEQAFYNATHDVLRCLRADPTLRVRFEVFV